MSDWDRIDPPATVFGWPNAWLHSLLYGIASDLPAMATEKGMHAAVGEALRRMATSRNEAQKHLAEVEAQRNAALAEIERLKAELDEVHVANDRLAGILRRTAVALKGPEPESGLHSWHDLPEVAAQLKAELAESQERRLGWAAKVGKLAAQRAELREEIARVTADRDKAWDRIDQLTHLLLLAHKCIRHGFMDGQWATIVQTQKELLPSVAVMESKHAEVVINAITKALRPKEKA